MSLPDRTSFVAEDFGPTHRWVVFVCSVDGHPMCVGYTDEEYARCDACGADLLPITVGPVNDGS